MKDIQQQRSVDATVRDAEGPASLDGYLRRQAGVITRAQALAAGLSADTVDRRLATRRWRPIHPRVYLDGAHRFTDEARARAAVLWAGEDAVLSGIAAAWWHGLATALPARISVTVPRRRHPRPRDGVMVRRRDLPATDVVCRQGVAVTGVALSVLEAAVELGDPAGRFLDQALRRGLAPDVLVAAHERNLTAAGASTARLLLTRAANRLVTAAEQDLVALLRNTRLIGWRAGHPVAGFVLPVAFPAVRVAVEVTGPDWPRGGERAQRTQWKRAVLRREGWTVLPLRAEDVTRRPDEVLVAIGRTVAHGRRAG